MNWCSGWLAKTCRLSCCIKARWFLKCQLQSLSSWSWYDATAKPSPGTSHSFCFNLDCCSYASSRFHLKNVVLPSSALAGIYFKDRSLAILGSVVVLVEALFQGIHWPQHPVFGGSWILFSTIIYWSRLQSGWSLRHLCCNIMLHKIPTCPDRSNGIKGLKCCIIGWPVFHHHRVYCALPVEQFTQFCYAQTLSCFYSLVCSPSCWRDITVCGTCIQVPRELSLVETWKHLLVTSISLPSSFICIIPHQSLQVCLWSQWYQTLHLWGNLPCLHSFSWWYESNLKQLIDI